MKSGVDEAVRGGFDGDKEESDGDGMVIFFWRERAEW